MPLVRRDIAPAAAAAGADEVAARAALRSADPDMRWNAARALGADPASVASLAAALETEPVARVREAIMTALMRIGNEESVKALLPYLREQDAAGAAPRSRRCRRCRTRPRRSCRRCCTTPIRTCASSRSSWCAACRPRRRRVCCATFSSMSRIPMSAPRRSMRWRRSAPGMHCRRWRHCARRFADTPFLPFAISIAITRISNGKG